ncbi:hypothetical protein [Bacillus nakamurai]|nr:hypothetical protein [Bacillus nakamurai]MCC9023493.1 hypothetical protein [Bacillus nakamurai]
MKVFVLEPLPFIGRFAAREVSAWRSAADMLIHLRPRVYLEGKAKKFTL